VLCVRRRSCAAMQARASGRASKLQVPGGGGGGATGSSPQASPRLGSKRASSTSRSGSKQSTAGKQSLGRVSSKLRKGSKEKSLEPALPGGWTTTTERNNFLQKVRRDLGHRDNERLERLEAIMEVRQLALQRQNCWPLWEDEQVRRALLDAIQAPDPERGKSLYVDEGPPPNHPTIRTAACGVLVQLALDDAVQYEMASDTLVRESIVEALEQLPPLPPVDDDAESSPKAKDPKAPSPKEPTPFDTQSRAQQLLALLLPAGICAKALRPPAFVEPDARFVWVEESEEEEMSEDDPVVDPMQIEVARPATAPRAEEPSGPLPAAPDAQQRKAEDASSAASSEVDPSSLLEDVEAILNAKKPSTDEDLLYASAACAEPLNPEEELQGLPPWRPGAARSRRLDTLWSFAATSGNAENGQLWHFEKVRDVLLSSAEAHQPECVRISALGTLAALAAREENRVPMWDDPRVKKVFIVAAAEQVVLPAETSAEGEAPKAAQMRPQCWEIRLQALLGLSAFAQAEDRIRQEIWSDPRLVASLQNAAEKPGPLRDAALQTLRALTQCYENQEPMVQASVPLLLGASSADESLAKRQRRGCELARDRLLVA